MTEIYPLSVAENLFLLSHADDGVQDRSQFSVLRPQNVAITLRRDDCQNAGRLSRE
jgi:hypothetical protein